MFDYEYLLETKLNSINETNKQDIKHFDVLFLRYEPIDTIPFAVFKQRHFNKDFIHLEVKSLFTLENYAFKNVRTDIIDFQEFNIFKKRYEKRRKIIGDILLCNRIVRIYFAERNLSVLQPCVHIVLEEEVEILVSEYKQQIVKTYDSFYLLDIVQMSDCDDKISNWITNEIY